MSRLAVTRSDLVPSGVIAQPQYDSPWSGMGEGLSVLPGIIRSMAQDKQAQDQMDAALRNAQVKIESLDIQARMTLGMEDAKSKALEAGSHTPILEYAESLKEGYSHLPEDEIAKLNLKLATAVKAASSATNASIAANNTATILDLISTHERDQLDLINSAPLTDAQLKGLREEHEGMLRTAAEAGGIRDTEIAPLSAKHWDAMLKMRETFDKRQAQEVTDYYNSLLVQGEEAKALGVLLNTGVAHLTPEDLKTKLEEVRGLLKAKVNNALVGEVTDLLLAGNYPGAGKVLERAKADGASTEILNTLGKIMQPYKKAHDDKFARFQKASVQGKIRTLIQNLPMRSKEDVGYFMEVLSRDIAFLAGLDGNEGKTSFEVADEAILPLLEELIQTPTEETRDRFDLLARFTSASGETQLAIQVMKEKFEKEYAETGGARAIAEQVRDPFTGVDEETVEAIGNASPQKLNKVWRELGASGTPESRMKFLKILHRQGKTAPSLFLEELNNSVLNPQTVNVGEFMDMAEGLGKISPAYRGQLVDGITTNSGVARGIVGYLEQHGNTPESRAAAQALFSNPAYFTVVEMVKGSLEKEGGWRPNYEVPRTAGGVALDILSYISPPFLAYRIAQPPAPRIMLGDKRKVSDWGYANLADNPEGILESPEPDAIENAANEAWGKAVTDWVGGMVVVKVNASAVGASGDQYIDAREYGISGPGDPYAQSLQEGVSELSAMQFRASPATGVPAVPIFGAPTLPVPFSLDQTGDVVVQRSFMNQDIEDNKLRTVRVIPALAKVGRRPTAFLEFNVNTGEHRIVTPESDADRFRSLTTQMGENPYEPAHAPFFATALDHTEQGKFVEDLSPSVIESYHDFATYAFYEEHGRLPHLLSKAERMALGPEALIVAEQDIARWELIHEAHARSQGAAGFYRKSPNQPSAEVRRDSPASIK